MTLRNTPGHCWLSQLEFLKALGLQKCERTLIITHLLKGSSVSSFVGFWGDGRSSLDFPCAGWAKLPHHSIDVELSCKHTVNQSWVYLKTHEHIWGFVQALPHFPSCNNCLLNVLKHHSCFLLFYRILSLLLDRRTSHRKSGLSQLYLSGNHQGL